MSSCCLHTVMFIGGVVAATMETINENSLPVHSFGVVARWIVMYPVQRLMACTISCVYMYSPFPLCITIPNTRPY